MQFDGLCISLISLDMRRVGSTTTILQVDGMNGWTAGNNIIIMATYGNGWERGKREQGVGFIVTEL